MVNSLEVITKANEIIVADDDEGDVCLLNEALEEMGYTVHYTPKGKEVFPLLKKTQAGAVITDYDMSDINGEELAYELKKTYMLGKTEDGLIVILRTGRRFEEQKRIQLKRDGIIYVSKMEPDEIVINLLKKYRRAA